ncbi:MAG TPA: hypothetical protein VFR33_03865 [Candidatus Dormibacteraeota bacterium]|nr:hypothetical protein [Candidatus Dormibacteraeota bacterium]
MTKSMITKVWIGGLAVFAAGIIVALVGVFLMLGYGGTFTQIAGSNNYQFDPNIDGFFWVTIALIVTGGVIAFIGSIGQFVAWIGGMVNSYALPERTWFAVLLIGGVLSFAFAPLGFAAMLAYVIGAPDGTPYRQAQIPAVAPQQRPMAPTA